jgi:UDP-N-acetylmuramoyl-tripeptide--D-alanyl-D-alanine ligase
LRSQGNLNNEFGLPLQLLKLEPEHEIAVVEMGMSHARRNRGAGPHRPPRLGQSITNVGSAHAQNFPDGVVGIARCQI